MILKKTTDEYVIHTTTCGDVTEVLTAADYRGVNMEICFDIRPNEAHFHKNFDEIYFSMDGRFDLRFYDPVAGAFAEASIGPNEMVLIPRGVHHVIVRSDPKNRLLVLNIPFFDAGDEFPSDKL